MREGTKKGLPDLETNRDCDLEFLIVGILSGPDLTPVMTALNFQNWILDKPGIQAVEFTNFVFILKFDS